MLGLLMLATAVTGHDGVYEWCLAPEQSLAGITCTAFVSGAIGAALEVDKMQGSPPPFCIPPKVTQRGREVIVVAYLEKHPEFRDRNGAGVVVAAMHEAFPCP